MPSLSESEKALDGVKKKKQHMIFAVIVVLCNFIRTSLKCITFSLFQGEASIFHVAMGRTTDFSKSTLKIEHVTAFSGLDTCKQYHEKALSAGLVESFYILSQLKDKFIAL